MKKSPRKWIAVLLSIFILIGSLGSISVAAVPDAPTATAHLSAPDTVVLPDQLAVDVALDPIVGGVGVNLVSFAVTYDPSKVQVVESTSPITGMELFVENDNTTTGVYEALFVIKGSSSVTFAERTVFAQVTFEPVDPTAITADATLPVSVSLTKCYASGATAEDAVQYTDQIGTATANSVFTATVPGVTVSGSFVCWDKEEEAISVSLTKEGDETPAYTATEVGNTGSYTIEGVVPGSYTVTVSKKNHVTREYALTVSDTAVTRDVLITIPGDVNLNGEIDAIDANQIQRYFNGLSSVLTSADGHSDYRLLVANVNNSDAIDAIDANQIQRYFNGLSSVLSSLIQP